MSLATWGIRARGTSLEPGRGMRPGVLNTWSSWGSSHASSTSLLILVMEEGTDFGLLGPGLASPGAGRFWRDPQGPGVQQQLGWVRPSLEQLVCPYWNRYLLPWLWGPRWGVCLGVAWVPQHRPGVMPLLGGGGDLKT